MSFHVIHVKIIFILFVIASSAISKQGVVVNVYCANGKKEKRSQIEVDAP